MTITIIICILLLIFIFLSEPLTSWITRRKEERKPKTKEQERDKIKDLYDKKLLQIQRQDIET